MHWASFWAIFFTNSSGHPGRKLLRVSEYGAIRFALKANFVECAAAALSCLSIEDERIANRVTGCGGEKKSPKIWPNPFLCQN
jgi:hypothetical protein